MHKQKFYLRHQVRVTVEKIICHFILMNLKKMFTYLSLFIAELKEAFQQLDFWLNFEIFDPENCQMI